VARRSMATRSIVDRSARKLTAHVVRRPCEPRRSEGDRRLRQMRHHGLMERREGLSIDDARLAECAVQHGIRRVALFGSALRPGFASDSDIDLLVEFEDLSTYFRHQSPLHLARCMRPEDRVRLAHLHHAASKAIAYSSGKTRSDLDDDELLRLALTKLVEIVGEAAKQVSAETRAGHPEVPWTAARCLLCSRLQPGQRRVVELSGFGPRMRLSARMRRESRSAPGQRLWSTSLATRRAMSSTSAEDRARGPC